MAYSEAQKRATRKYNGKTYKRIPLDIRKEDAEKLKSFCDGLGVPVNTFIKSAIREKMERESEK